MPESQAEGKIPHSQCLPLARSIQKPAGRGRWEPNFVEVFSRPVNGCKVKQASSGTLTRLWSGWALGQIYQRPGFVNKFYWNKATPTHLHIVCDYFDATSAELSPCNKDHMAFYRKFADPGARLCLTHSTTGLVSISTLLLQMGKQACENRPDLPEAERTRSEWNLHLTSI